MDLDGCVHFCGHAGLRACVRACVYTCAFSSILHFSELDPSFDSTRHIYLPIQFIVDPKSAKLLELKEYKKLFNYQSFEIISNDYNLKLK